MAVPAVTISPGSAARVTTVPANGARHREVLAVVFGFGQLGAGLLRLCGCACDFGLLLRQSAFAPGPPAIRECRGWTRFAWAVVSAACGRFHPALGRRNRGGLLIGRRRRLQVPGAPTRLRTSPGACRRPCRTRQFDRLPAAARDRTARLPGRLRPASRGLRCRAWTGPLAAGFAPIAAAGRRSARARLRPCASAAVSAAWAWSSRARICCIVEHGDRVAGVDAVALAHANFQNAAGGFGGDGGVVPFDAAADGNNAGGHGGHGEKRLPDNNCHSNQDYTGNDNRDSVLSNPGGFRTIGCGCLVASRTAGFASSGAGGRVGCSAWSGALSVWLSASYYPRFHNGYDRTMLQIQPAKIRN